jgi:predicted ribonuclease YlaK
MDFPVQEILVVDTNVLIRHFQKLVNFAQNKKVFTTYGVVNEI